MLHRINRSIVHLLTNCSEEAILFMENTNVQVYSAIDSNIHKSADTSTLKSHLIKHVVFNGFEKLHSMRIFSPSASLIHNIP